jgi:hypothetical protein
VFNLLAGAARLYAAQARSRSDCELQAHVTDREAAKRAREE